MLNTVTDRNRLYLSTVLCCIKGNFLCEFGGLHSSVFGGYGCASPLDRFATFRRKRSSRTPRPLKMKAAHSFETSGKRLNSGRPWMSALKVATP
jgi:hypothetical protein